MCFNRIILENKYGIMKMALCSLDDPGAMAEILEIDEVEVVRQACRMLLKIENYNATERMIVCKALRSVDEKYKLSGCEK